MPGIAILALLFSVLVTTAAHAQTPPPAETPAQAPVKAPPAKSGLGLPAAMLNQPWTGDLDGMIKRRLIREPLHRDGGVYEEKVGADQKPGGWRQGVEGRERKSRQRGLNAAHAREMGITGLGTQRHKVVDAK